MLRLVKNFKQDMFSYSISIIDLIDESFTGRPWTPYKKQEDNLHVYSDSVI